MKELVKDKKTLAYFNESLPIYSPSRFEKVIEFIIASHKSGDSLIDIGCGIGNILQLVLSRTPITNVTGMDVSQIYTTKLQENLDCKVCNGSILDTDFIISMHDRYDYVLMGAVLHHLIGKTRNQSKLLTKRAILNALKLCKTKGYLLIVEPTYSSPFMMSILFYMKKLFTFFTMQRFEIFGVNIGMPVTSMYSNKQLIKYIDAIPALSIVSQHRSIIRKYFGVVRNETFVLIIQKKNTT